MSDDQLTLLRRSDNIISPVQDFGRGLASGKCPRQGLSELVAGWKILDEIENSVMLSNKVAAHRSFTPPKYDMGRVQNIYLNM